MNKNKNDLVNTSKFKIDLYQFNSTMDRLARSYSTSKKVTEFDRKVGNSVCRAAELAMSDLQARPKKPKFRFQTILLLPAFFEGMIISANTIQTTNSG